MQKQGFTLIELLVVIGILSLLLVLGLLAFRPFEREKVLEGASQELIATLEEAQNNTLASEAKGSWGVSFDISTTPHAYTLFQGSSFASRNTAYDKAHAVPLSIEFSSLNIEDSEVVFSRLTRFPANAGDVGLRQKGETQETRVFIAANGDIETADPGIPSDASRVKDTRHIHLSYTRIINTANETVTLTFSNQGSPITKDIVIAGNLIAGQLFWEGTVSVGGQDQKLKVQTHFLNDAVQDTQFSLKRDKRVNTKGFAMTISGDTTGSLIEYDDSGEIINGTSLYVSSPSIQ
ncbi:MAG: prepilin-type N-terminal cleavage/methylation domain-containing protein [Candidatus Wildermuthbacteria bacterium]|nr:prepilin-type N-terminal cleavage/methylation domain-containing protein [Candidatus Wildermuthbacteria bacterium]